MSDRAIGTIVHIAAAASIMVIVLLVWWTQDGRREGLEEERTRRALATLLAQTNPRGDDIVRALESLTPFPPSHEATAAVAGILASCNLAGLHSEQRMRAVRALDAIMNGGYLTAGELARAIDGLRRAAAVSCGPERTAALVDAAHHAARDVPDPRRDWW